ncbi:MAG: glycosyltransferase [Elusimicrobiales bacterium]
MSYNIKITYFGIIKSISSWSKVSRNIIKSLISFGVDVNIYERKGFLYEEDFNLEPEIGSKITNGFDGDIVFTFEHPKNYVYLPQNKIKIGFLVYEFTELCDLWVCNINKYLDAVFVPSKFTYDVFAGSGVKREKIKILRYGFDPEYYYPKKEKNENNKRFLTISSPHKREALDYTLKAFYEAFSNNKDVKLTLKLSYLNKTVKPFEIDAFKTVNFYKQRLGNRLSVITDKLSEKEMGELYRNSDWYFSLSKSESFGLCFLEALACGIGVCCLNYGGQRDFLNSENAVFINHYLDKTEGDEYEKSSKIQYVAYPDMSDAVTKLKKIYLTENAIRKNLDMKYYIWDNVAKDFLKEMERLIR